MAGTSSNHRPLRCEEAILALGEPSWDGDRKGLADHLASCHDCAQRAARDEALDRLWEATRPVEPGPETWDAVWNQVAARLDQAMEPASAASAVIPFQPARPRWIRGMLIVAQVAALAMLAVGLTFRDRGPEPNPAQPSPAPVALTRVDIEEGQTVVIRFDDGAAETIALTRDDSRNSLDAYFIALNELEAQAE